MSKGDLFVLSAPSGAGKTTLCKRILAKFNHIIYSVSYTTRNPRQGETDGKDYNFVSKSLFEDMIKNNEFIEYALVHGNYYGTSKKWLNERLEQGKDIVLDIDVQGAIQLKKIFSNAILIFILPPSLEELENRLRLRNTDNPDIIRLRLDNARQEIKGLNIYDYAVINDDLEKAVIELESIIQSVFCKVARVLSKNPHFII